MSLDRNFDAISYLLGKKDSSGGGGNNVIISHLPPSQSDGEVGWYYIYETVALPVIYDIKIETAGRDNDTSFFYWGAREINLIFTDGHNDFDFNMFSDTQCKVASGSSNFSDAGALIDGNTDYYNEYTNLPGWFEFSAIIPSSYAFKTLSICGRNDYTLHDYWVDFNFGQVDVSRNFINTIISETNLTYDDWNHSAQNSFTDFSPSTPVDLIDTGGSYPYYELYYKNIDGWDIVASS